MSGTSTSRPTRLPSLGVALEGARRALRRFPSVLIAAVVSTAAASCSSETLGPDWVQLRLLATATLALPLLTAVTLTGERLARRDRWLLHGIALLALVAFFAAWPMWTPEGRGLRYVQLSAAFHLLVAVLPLGALAAGPVILWQYNRALLERLLAAGVAALSLYAGLALALLAADKLFGVDVPGEGYFRLFATIGFVFTTWFFLGGLPQDLAEFAEPREYPQSLRVFAQYILTPLVAMYLVILTLYLVKVVATWQWPSGWIGWLVSGVATAGIFALLLVQPIAEDPEQRWIHAFSRAFWIAILPAIVMLWLAIGQRVRQYGITEPRYFLIVLSLWLAAMAVYFRTARSPRIAMIPASLCLLAAVTFAGPWSAYAVARHSQEARLRTALEHAGVLVDGRVRKPSAPPADADVRRINGGIRYLATLHGTSAVAWLAPQRTRTRITATREPDEGTVRELVTGLGIPYMERWSSRAGPADFTIAAIEPAAPVSVAGFDLLVPLRLAQAGAADTGLTATLVPGGTLVRVRRGDRVLVDVALDSLLALARARAGGRRFTALPGAMLLAEATGPGGRSRIWVRRLEGKAGAARVGITSLQGYALIQETKR